MARAGWRGAGSVSSVRSRSGGVAATVEAPATLGIVGLVQDLQRRAGNRAVTGVIQRRELDSGLQGRLNEAVLSAHGPEQLSGVGASTTGPEAAPLLDAEQVRAAERWYTSQPGQYPQPIIDQIRTALQLPAGGVDEDLVQAVAHFQDRDRARFEIKIDGKAGPRTLPRMFREGLNDPAHAAAFTAGVTQEMGRWGSQTAVERRSAFAQLVAEAEIDAGVRPTPVVVDKKLSPGATGQLDPRTWQINVGLTVFDDAVESANAANELTETLYHEARHAQQWFEMARMLAGRGTPAAAIAARMDMDRRAVNDAHSEPLPPGSMQAVIAKGWFDDWFGNEERTQAIEDTAGRAKVALDRAKAADDAHSTAATRRARAQAQARFDRAIAAYHDIAVENDAFATTPELGGVPGSTPAPGSGDLVPDEPQDQVLV